MSFRKQYASNKVPNVVFVIKNIDNIPRFTPGIIFMNKPMHKLYKDDIYLVSFPIPVTVNSRITEYDIRSRNLQLVKNHPLSRLVFKDIHVITDDILIKAEEYPIIYEIKPVELEVGLSKKFVYETLLTLSNMYEYCWSYTENPCHNSINIIKKVSITSIKNVFPIFDRNQANGICVCVHTGHPLESADLSQGLVFLLSNFKTNITMFDGAVLRNMDKSLTANGIRNKIYTFSNIYSIQEDKSVCVE